MRNARVLLQNAPTANLCRAQFLWTLLIMALTGNIIAEAFSGNPSVINYDMFVAVFAMLTLFYLFAAAVKEDLGHSIVLLVLDALNTIFFFCGAVAMAAELHVHSCSNAAYTFTNPITNGSTNPAKRCREAQAVTAFLWFGFAAFAASLVMTGLTSGGSTSSRGT